MSSVLTLPFDVLPLVRHAVGGLPDVVVMEGPTCALVIREGAMTVDLVNVNVEQLDSVLDRHSSNPRLLLIDGVLDDETAARLEDSTVGYVDASGRAWILGSPRSKLARTDTGALGSRPLSPSRLLAAQMIVDHPERRWTERELASQTNVSTGTAHYLLARLEDEGLLSREGTKRGTIRKVNDQQELRHWLAQHGRPRRVRRLPCFLREIKTGNINGLQVALTGAAAAEALGIPVLTNVSQSLLRIGISNPGMLDEVPAALGGMRTRKGANAVLIADVHSLGLLDARKLSDGTLVAPPSRVMLDLFLEPRGESAVDVMLALWKDSPSHAGTVVGNDS